MDKFNFNGISLKAVKTNVRPSTDDKPYLTLSQTPGRFNLNPLATNLMKVESGDTVSFFENENESSMNGRFFICKGIGTDVAKLYSPAKSEGIGRALAFSMAGTYSRMIQGKADAVEVSTEVLEKQGLMVSRASEKNPKKRNYSASVIVRFEVVEGPITTFEVNDVNVDVQLYALVNPVLEDAFDNIQD